MDGTTHRPVLLRETLEALRCRPGGFWVDGTVGAGGHAEAILRATAPDGRLLGCDRDPDALAATSKRLAPCGERVLLRHADYRRLPALLDELGLDAVSGILLDLGVSSLQLDDPERGFSFREDGPLDMRMDRTQPATAADLVNSAPADRLASILETFGEEPQARRIARAIARARARAPITTTRALADIVSDAIPARRGGRIHPATRAFQALRIAVNAELDGLDRLLEDAARRLLPGGRIVVIAFHSLEDRIVKGSLRGLTRRCLCPRDLPVCACGRPGILKPVTPRAVRPATAEIEDNPRSRSARLRAFERLEPAA
ncbi:MAG TPA: 16S rRNA (cytosine(1402)-N(4))-methyltransferase RsmH [Candidatus Polarisedimenticolia bacterium]|jgi:16S rRNA (cytosine1402-N4)-methyltransferase|nr:16S rRNA (cytosine(1402)-N(4))-methyltransferase RsmH [Candidatus Polarisedimenticolia bacterium]